MEDRDERPSSCYIRPHEAWKRLKEAQSTGQTVYIWGSTGCGKTALIENYLARRAYEYYPVTSGGRLKLPEKSVSRARIVVVDDLHRLWQPEERARLLPDLERLAAAPKVWLILIGRPALPAWLRPLSLKGGFTVLGEDALCLTAEEEADFWLRFGLDLTEETVRKSRETGGGHLLFLLAAAQELSALEKGGDDRAERELAALTRAQTAGADYLDVHVFDQWDVSIREFLMELSVVKSFDLDMARIITKNSEAARYLQLAQETGAFLTETDSPHGTVYVMREPMRWTMQRRLARTRTREELDELCFSAASAYELRGDALSALAMYEACGNQAAITRLLIANARLYAGAGSYWQMRRYYLALPEDVILRNPELMAGMSMLCSIMLRDDESENWYRALSDYASRQTGSARRDAQMRLCYLDIALPHRGIAKMPDLLRICARWPDSGSCCCRSCR